MTNKKLIPIVLGGLGIAGLIYLMRKKEEGLLDDCDGFDVDCLRWKPIKAASNPELSTNRVQGKYSIAMGKSETGEKGSHYYNQSFVEPFSCLGKDLYFSFYLTDINDIYAITIYVGRNAMLYSPPPEDPCFYSPEDGRIEFGYGHIYIDELDPTKIPGWVNVTFHVGQDLRFIDDLHFIGFAFWTEDPDALLEPGRLLLDNWRLVDIE